MIGGLVFWQRGEPVTAPMCRAMSGQLAGTKRLRRVGLGTVGLFSFDGADESESTDQIWAVAELDLTNVEELRALAGAAGRHAGLLTALYHLEGLDFVRRLRGGFAVALWDRRHRTLLLAVDRFGIRRLHYATDYGRTAFASRASAVVAAPGVERRLDLTAVYNYLNLGYVPAPGSIFAGVRRLAPGQIVVVRQGEASARSYWDMAYVERPVRRAEGAALLYRLTEEAVAQALRGIGVKEVGAFLSGGTDSSTLVGLMSRLTGGRVNAFSIGFREERYDELAYAELAAQHFAATHYTRIVTPGDAFEQLPRLVEAYDEPFGNNSLIGTYFGARLAGECGVRCLLAGDGGDEIFGGNERYRTDRIFAAYGRLPRWLQKRVIEPILFALPDGGGSPLGRAQRYIGRARIPNPRRFYSYEFFVAQHAEDLLTPDFRAAVATEAPYAIVQAYYDRHPGIPELNRLLYLDLKLAIGDNDLLKVTRTAELAGVAVRFPLLDPPLVEFTGTLPASFKVRGLEKRYLFKRAFRSLLPPETLAKRKHGFGVPTSVWLKSHHEFCALARDTLLSTCARQRGYFRPAALETLFARHAADSTPYYGDILWALLMLELWHRHHWDRNGAA